MSAEKKFYLTKEGLENIKKEYSELKKIKQAKTGGRDEVPEVLHSEELNPDYLHFLEDLNFLETRMIELENIMKNTELIKTPSAGKRKIIDVGATVSVEVDGQKDELVIVETFEANPSIGKISKESPVGKALLGSREGESVTVSSPVKTIYKIKKIDYHLS